jgi:GAF domain-containing protein
MKLSIFNSPQRPKPPQDGSTTGEAAPGAFETNAERQPVQANVNPALAGGDGQLSMAGFSPSPDSPIDALRWQILNRLLLVTILLGVLVYLISLPGLLQGAFTLSLGWIALGLYSLIWIFALVAVLRKRMPYAWRAGALLLTLFASGLVGLLVGSAYGSGQVILFVAPFIAAVLLGPRSRTASLLLSIAALALCGLLLVNGIVPAPAAPDEAGWNSPFSWIMALAIFALLACGGVVSLGVLLDGLQSHLESSRVLASDLESQRGQEAAKAADRANDLHRRLVQIRTVAEINRAISRVLDIDQLLPQVCELVRQRFNLYYVGIFLIEQSMQRPSSQLAGAQMAGSIGSFDEAYSPDTMEPETSGPTPTAYAVLKAGSGEAGRIMLAEGHKLAVGGDSMIGWATANRQPRIAQKVRQEGAAGPIARFDNPHLPLTRSELALPILISDVTIGEESLANTSQEIRVLGAMTIQSTQEGAFDQDDIVILQGIADGLASAIENARLFEATQANLEEIRTLHRQYLEQAWRLETALRGEIEYSFEDETRMPTGAETDLEIPIRLRDQVIGSLTLEPPAPGAASQDVHHAWTPDDLALVEAVTNQAALALENARLLEETRRKVNLEHTAATITSKLWASADVETILRTALQELGASLGAREGSIELTLPEGRLGTATPSGGSATERVQTQGEDYDAAD